MEFNPKPSTIMHIDLNSCFATIEQQANPHLRGKPVAVAAYTTPSGCIIAPSIEAKRFGIKVGMRVKDGKLLYPDLVVLPPDPWKYRNVHLALRKLLANYTPDITPKSIDEFVLNLEGCPAISTPEESLRYTSEVTGWAPRRWKSRRMLDVGREIKMRIKKEIGDWLTVSVGIAPNRFLAKVAAGLHKPDGLDEINKANFLDVYSNLPLTDIFGIKERNAARLNSVGIYSTLDFYKADFRRLKSAFLSINAYYWYLRLRGFEIDDVAFGRRSYGNSYALPKPFVTLEELSPILTKLVEKMGSRLRRAGYRAKGIHIAVTYRNGCFWHKAKTFDKVFFDSRDIYKEALRIMSRSPYKSPVRDLAVSCFNLIKGKSIQLELFENIEKKESLVRAIDAVNERWGNFVITPARMLWATEAVPDRIAFGGIKELEEFTLNDTND